ncbi:hypothetical protein JK211_14510 [Tatumella sp. JGM130]|uniref:hypothetical protein n=1 Tax=Tatumella sp. JGM130 TaxID=2799797 RepID=UPI001BB0B4C5|nr:hypothetical protein [Tatumella sp. JGM130]MBS0895227.1 hypothetical protein [Tatumella sp. JGM130]
MRQIKIGSKQLINLMEFSFDNKKYNSYLDYYNNDVVYKEIEFTKKTIINGKENNYQYSFHQFLTHQLILKDLSVNFKIDENNIELKVELPDVRYNLIKQFNMDEREHFLFNTYIVILPESDFSLHFCFEYMYPGDLVCDYIEIYKGGELVKKISRMEYWLMILSFSEYLKKPKEGV